MPIPSALAPCTEFAGWPTVPGKVQQNSHANGGHQIWCDDALVAGCDPTPNVYEIALQVGQHRITNGRVQALQFADGMGSGAIDDIIDVDNTGAGRPVRRVGAPVGLPYSTITGFSGTPHVPNSATFPGPMINAEYWKSNNVRFINQLGDDNGLDMGDFGDPERGFLTHLHNAHTACESDGNPNDTHHQYCHGEWVDNMYLNYPAGGDSKEMQSFFWFHDHTHGHTGANVYKGMVGLYPIYDPLKDNGNEKKGFRLPGVRTNRPDGAFDVKYDIPLALYDCLLDDGVTPHRDWHNGCGETHPEWWGHTFFRHYPNHGFVGDVFTVNGKAYPVLKAKRRKYRLRFLGASIARVYELMFMRKRAGQTIQAVPGLQGQYSFGNIKPDGTFERDLGEQCFRPRQIASEGGLLPRPIDRDMFQIWPANRKEIVIDFTKFMDGTPTKDGDEFYLVNILKMKNGRKPNNEAVGDDGVADPEFDPRYCVPLMKIVIDGSNLVARQQPHAGPGRLRRRAAQAAADPDQLRQRAGSYLRARPLGRGDRRGRVDHQRCAVESAGDHGAAEEECRRDLDPEEQERRLGASDAPAHGGAPGARDQAHRLRRAAAAAPGSAVEGGCLRPRTRRRALGLSEVPDLPGQVRRPLPQPRARGSRDDVRLGNHPIARTSHCGPGLPAPARFRSRQSETRLRRGGAPGGREMKKATYLVVLVAAVTMAFVIGSWTSPVAGSITTARRIHHYKCPMHPHVTSPHPGTTPCCGMRFEPVYEDALEPAAAQTSAGRPPLRAGAAGDRDSKRSTSSRRPARTCSGSSGASPPTRAISTP